MNHINAFIRSLRSKRVTTEKLAELYGTNSACRYEVQVACALRHAAIQDLAISIGDNEYKLLDHAAVFTWDDRESFAQRLETIVSIVRKYKADYLREMHLEISRSVRRLAYDLEEYELAADKFAASDYYPLGIIQEYGTPFDRNSVYAAFQDAYRALCEFHTHPADMIPLEVAKAARMYASFQQDRGWSGCRLDVFDL